MRKGDMVTDLQHNVRRNLASAPPSLWPAKASLALASQSNAPLSLWPVKASLASASQSTRALFVLASQSIRASLALASQSNAPLSLWPAKASVGRRAVADQRRARCASRNEHPATALASAERAPRPGQSKRERTQLANPKRTRRNAGFAGPRKCSPRT